MRTQFQIVILCLGVLFGLGLCLSGCHPLTRKEKRAEMQTQIDSWELSLAAVWEQVDSNIASLNQYQHRLGADTVSAGNFIPLLADSASRAEYQRITNQSSITSHQAYDQFTLLKAELGEARSWVNGLVYNEVTRKQADQSWELRKTSLESQISSLEETQQGLSGQVWLMKQLVERVAPNNSEPVSPVP